MSSIQAQSGNILRCALSYRHFDAEQICMKITLYRDYKEEGWESMEVYADHLADALRRGRKQVHIDEFVALPWFSARLARRSKIIRYIFRFIINPTFSFWRQGEVNHVIDQANAHLLLVLDPRKTVVTCHDLIVPYWVMRHVPQTYIKRVKRIGELWRIRFLKKAARIIAVSNATKTDIIETLGISPDKITVIPEGVDQVFRTPVSENKRRMVQKNYRLPSRYILHVGTTHEYKNMETLIRLFSQLRTVDTSLHLVKVGSPWTQKQRNMLRRMSLLSYVTHVGFVPLEDLPSIYVGALALVHPSKTEGFGFTVLEAMSVGCPVVISDIPALKEMAGSAGIYIHTDPTASDVDSVRSLLHSKKTRLRCIRLGLIRAKRYSWQRSASLTYRVYRDIFQMLGGGV